MLKQSIYRLCIIALVCMQTQVFAEPLSIRLPIITKQPAIDYHYIKYHNSSGSLCNPRYTYPDNLSSLGD